MKGKSSDLITVIAVLFCSYFSNVLADMTKKDEVGIYTKQEEISLFGNEKINLKVGYDAALEYSSFSRLGLDKNQFS